MFMIAKQIILSSRPSGFPSINNFSEISIELPQLLTGEVLLQGVFYSVDPYMRGRMNNTESYISPFEINEPISGGVVAKVVASNATSLLPGDFVIGMLPWQTHMVVDANAVKKIDTHIAPASYYLGILGMPGLTAYFGLIDIGQPKVGETVVVSGAAGAVGVVVGQIAKIMGCKVIGIAGGTEKITILKNEFHFDEVIDYKNTVNINKAIQMACPNGIDIYFDNVGGEISDAVIRQINYSARIVLCGQIALYNDHTTPIGPRLQPILLTKSALMQGFIISNYANRFSEGITQLSEWLKDGKLQYKETILHGFHQLPEAFIGLFVGKNLGKMIVEA
jgi:NADPH-dependent curcumin reductase CurA